MHPAWLLPWLLGKGRCEGAGASRPATTQQWFLVVNESIGLLQRASSKVATPDAHPGEDEEAAPSLPAREAGPRPTSATLRRTAHSLRVAGDLAGCTALAGAALSVGGCYAVVDVATEADLLALFFQTFVTSTACFTAGRLIELFGLAIRSRKAAMQQTPAPKPT